MNTVYFIMSYETMGYTQELTKMNVNNGKKKKKRIAIAIAM